MNTGTRTFTVRDELYARGQFAKHLSPGDVRLESSAAQNGVADVVHRTRGGGCTAVLGNGAGVGADRRVRMSVGGRTFVVTVPTGSFATYRWTR
ncbi:hypothetical protein [Streptomyces sp. NPDC101237]|uniref:hypothetical protein n=1 Tax=Streptomyces sp. NPDC101237 TaxID=3366139 RepID=UPI0038182C82